MRITLQKNTLESIQRQIDDLLAWNPDRSKWGEITRARYNALTALEMELINERNAREEKAYQTRELCDGFKERDQGKIRSASAALKIIDKVITREREI